MSEWWPMLFFLSALIISTMMVLICGWANMQEERDDASSARDEGPDRSPFFASGTDFQASSVEPPRGGLESALRSYLEREQRVVAGFVSAPSLKSMYRESARPIAVEDLEHHLERELQYAAGFVADPSVEKLYRGSTRRAWIN